MLKDFIARNISSKLTHSPTNSQQEAIEVLSTFLCDTSNDALCILKGFAGTGKTTLLSALVATLLEQKNKTVLLAPTGRSSKVLSSYCRHHAFTIHKTIYRQKSLTDSNESFVMDFNSYTSAVFIVDEASMIADSSPGNSLFGSGRLLSDLISYIYNGKGNKLIITGDTAQLPPIGLEYSPALDKDYIETSFLKTVYSSTLRDIVRQDASSFILKNATLLRSLIANNIIKTPRLVYNEDSDTIAMSGSDIIESLTSAYDKSGIEETIVITRSNKVANIYNKGIRQRILWQEEEISVGDYIMIVQNNYFWTENIAEIPFIANGDIAKIVSINRFHELYDKHFADITINLVDYDMELDVLVLLETLQSENASLGNDDRKKFFFTVAEDYADIKDKRKRYKEIRNNKYLNALQIKFAYAVTCHKAQGGQWDHVYIDHGYMPEINASADMLKWMYTAITRAKKYLYFVNFNKEFFNGQEEDHL